MTQPSQSIRSRMSFLTVAHLMSAGCGFVAMWLVATHYGDANLGRYLNAFAWMTQALIITRFGSDQYAVRQVAAKNTLPGTTAASVIRLRAVAALAGLALLFVLPLLFERLHDIRWLLAILSLCVLPTIFRLEWVSQALHRTNVYGGMQLGLQALNALLVGLAIFLSLDLWAVAGARVLSEVLVACVLLIWITRNLVKLDFRSPGESVRAMARASAPIAGSQLLRGLCFGSDVLILGALVSDSDVGHYGPGFRIFLFLVALNSAYSVILFPRISSHANAEGGSMGQEVRRSLAVTVPLALIAAIGLASLAHPVITGLFGDDFAPGVNSLRILCIALVLNLVNRHLRQVLIACSRQGLDLRLTALGTLTHLGAKLALIPSFGIAGAAMGSVAGELVLMLALYFATRPLLRRAQ